MHFVPLRSAHWSASTPNKPAREVLLTPTGYTISGPALRPRQAETIKTFVAEQLTPAQKRLPKAIRVMLADDAVLWLERLFDLPDPRSLGAGRHSHCH